MTFSQIAQKVFFIILLTGILPAMATDYYVRPDIGNDSNPGTGTTDSTSWKTLAPINNNFFSAGDKVFLEGLFTYEGNINFDQLDSGTVDNPIEITSFGMGKATINSGESYGFFALNTAGISIKNIDFKGSGPSTNADDGIVFYSELSSTILEGIFLDNIEVSGYLKSGISIGVSDSSSKGFSNVRITQCISHDNGEAGMSSYGPYLNPGVLPHSNFYLAYNTVYNNSGRSEITNKHTGNGIMIAAVDNGIIEYCIAYNNGALNGQLCGGPVGIWCYNSNNITIQFCESYNNKAGKDCDGGGFDLDGGVTNSIVQYNYSHDNEGAGYLIAQYEGALPLKGNTLRYNISENDARRNSYGGIYLWSTGSNGGIQDAHIYNNTIYLTPDSASGMPSAIKVEGLISNVTFRNNIIQSTGGIPLVKTTVTSGITFQGNCYWSSGNAFNIQWGEDTYTTLSDFRALTNQERNGSTDAGFMLDPQLTSPGNGGIAGDTAQLNNLNAYRLKSISPIINSGINLKNIFGIDPGSRDFYGNVIPQHVDYDIGANEYIGTIPVCSSTGNILREVWTKTSGNEIKYIPVNNTPDSISYLNLYESPANAGVNYGSRIRGYICVPVTGNYTFWIASNDHSELWLSTNDDPANKVKIAFVTGYTSSRQWDKYSSQKSSLINLVAGKRYYTETLHKQGVGTDNVAVGWQLPNSTFERPIPGNRLSPFGGATNNSPVVSIINPTNGQTFTAPANITINANASDTDGSITKVEFLQGTTKLGEDLTAPYSFIWSNVASGSYAFTAKAFDNGGAETTSSVINITVSGGDDGCTASGTILREYWANTSGYNISGIPLSSPPTSTSQLSIFEGPSNVAANYGSRIRGYICVPASGNYTFWIASNDNSELWLSSDENPANKTKIAFVTGFTNSRQWNKYTSQKSALINLVAGKRYYIETLHIQNGGTDNIAVGWQLPNGTQERPISGNRLSPFSGSGNNPPTVSITSPVNGQTFTEPANITISANASDTDGSISKVEFYQSATKLGEDLTSPYSFTWSNVAAGSYALTSVAYDNLNASTTSGTVNITVSGGSGCTSSGTILREFWNGVSGISVSNIPTHLPPTSTSQVNIFEGPTNAGTNYGARYRGYICAPATGNYTFWIASNDDSELWLSTSDNPSSKVKIASVTGYTASREWTKYSSQKSALINLTAGQGYYIEALHKQGAGTDNVAIGWQLPNGTLERPIPGSRLSPVEVTESFSEPVRLMSTSEIENEIPIDVKVYPNPTQKGMVTLSIEGYEQTKHKVYINVLNMSGNIVYSDKASCEITCRRTIINIDERFTPGMYIVNVTIDNKIYTERLIVE